MKQNPIEKAVHLHQAGKSDKARSIYRKILKKNPDDVDALHFYGILSFQQGKTDEAIELIERALANNPDYPDAHNNLGNIYLQLGRLDEAKQCYEKTLQLAPGRLETHNNLGVLLRHMGDYPASVRHLQNALQLKPDWADAHYNLANTYAASDSNAEAVQHYRRAIELDPKFTNALKRLGLYLYSLGKIDEAVRLYRNWLKLEPDNPVVQHMLAACSGENTPERASDEYIRSTFDRFASSFDSKLEILEYRAPKHVAEAVQSGLPEPAGELMILDAGCGTGLCGPLLKPLAKNLTGVDLSKNMLNLARERNCYDELVCDELIAYISKFTDRYDVVVSADTLVYFGALEQAFRAAAKALKTGGILAFSVEKLDDETLEPGFRLEAHGRYAHSRSYVESTITNAGLEPASIVEAVLRKELSKPVDGWIVTAVKKSGGHA